MKHEKGKYTMTVLWIQRLAKTLMTIKTTHTSHSRKYANFVFKLRVYLKSYIGAPIVMNTAYKLEKLQQTNT